MRQIKEQTLKPSKNAVVFILLCWGDLGSACFGFGRQRWYFFLFFSFKFCTHKSLSSPFPFVYLDTQHIHLLSQIHSYTLRILTTPISSSSSFSS